MDKTSIDSLIAIVGRDNVLTTPEDLAVYSYDGTFAECKPEVVVQPLVFPGATAPVGSHITLPASHGTLASGIGAGAGSGRCGIQPGAIGLRRRV